MTKRSDGFLEGLMLNANTLLVDAHSWEEISQRKKRNNTPEQENQTARKKGRFAPEPPSPATSYTSNNDTHHPKIESQGGLIAKSVVMHVPTSGLVAQFSPMLHQTQQKRPNAVRHAFYRPQLSPWPFGQAAATYHP